MAKKWKNVPYTGSVTGAIEGAVYEIETLKDEMEQWRDGMEERLSHTDKYQEVSEACDALEEAYDRLQGIELPEGFDPNVTYTEMKPYGRKPEPRWMRWSNAQIMVSAAKAAIEEIRDEKENDGGNCECENLDSDMSEYGDHHEVDCPRHGEREEFDFDEVISALEDVENFEVNFPGMY